MKKPVLAFTFLILLCLFSCQPDEEPQGPVLDHLEIASSNGDRLDLVKKETTQLTVIGKDQSNQNISIEGQVSWESDKANASVDQNGLVMAVAAGTSSITARVGEVTQKMDISVWDSSSPRTEIFISDTGPQRQTPWQILRVYNDGEYTEVFTDDHLNGPQDIVVLEEEGIALVSNYSGNNITKYDLKDGTYQGIFASGIDAPTRIEIGPDRLIYVLQWEGNGLVLRYKKDGTPLGPFTDVGVFQSIGIAWDIQRNLYVSSFSNGNGSSYVRKFDAEGQDLGVFINTNLQGATDIWFRGDELLVNDFSTGSVKRFNSSGQYLDDFITGLSLVEGVARLNNGNLLIGNGGTSTVKVFSDLGTFVKDLIPSRTRGLATPNAVTIRYVN